MSTITDSISGASTPTVVMAMLAAVSDADLILSVIRAKESGDKLLNLSLVVLRAPLLVLRVLRYRWTRRSSASVNISCWPNLASVIMNRARRLLVGLLVFLIKDLCLRDNGLTGCR